MSSVPRWTHEPSSRAAKPTIPKCPGCTASAISRIDDFEPYVLEPPIEVELSLKHYRPVELLDYLPNVERVTSHTVRFVAEDMEQVSRFLTFVLNFRVDLQP